MVKFDLLIQYINILNVIISFFYIVLFFAELMNKSVIYENFENNILCMQHFTSISPLLCCMLHKTKEESHPSILSYLSYILIHTLHYQVIPQCLIYLAKDIKKLPVKEYLLSWLENNEPVNLEHIPSMTLTYKLNSIFLNDTELQINKIFNGNNVITFQYNEENIIIHHSLSTYEIIYSFKMTIFYLIQLSKKGVLTKVQSNNYKIFLISLLHIAKSSSNNYIILNECAKSIFTHPIILYYFSPFYQKNVLKTMMTLMLIDICNVIIALFKEYNIKNLFFHFKNKLLIQLYKMIDKKEKNEKINNIDMIITLLEILQLTSKEIVCLLKKLIKLENIMFISNDKNLSIYGYIVPKLLQIINSNEMKSERNIFFELNAEFVKDLCLHLLFLKSNLIMNYEIWEIALYEYFLNFSFNIGGIDISKLFS